MSPSNLEIMHPKGTNGFASSVIDKCENRPVDLQSLNLAHLIMSRCKKSGDIPV